jgi:EmrB/QacA subfamily drug resistance transporter
MSSLKSIWAGRAGSNVRVPVGVIIAIACVAQFVLVLNTTIAAVALPEMHIALGLSVDTQQWVINGYLVTFGGFLLLAGRAGDLFGERVVFRAGLVVFILASLAGGLAQSGGWLLAARIVQGIGAAGMAPASISLIVKSPIDDRRRTHALGLWSIAASAGGAAGLVLGGVLTSALSWRYVLYVNVPLGIALLVAASIGLKPSTASRDWRRLDIPGAVTVTLGIGAAVYGLSDASVSGWGSATVIAALAAAVVLLGAFAVVEARSSQPLVPFSIFRSRPLSIANILFAALGVTLTASIYFLSLYEEQILGYSAIRTGLTLVPMTALFVIGALVARRLVPIYGPRMPIIVGAIITTVGLAWLSRISVHSDYAADVLGPTVLSGAGMSLMAVPIVTAATIGIEPRLAGLASGLVNMSRQVGGAIGLAVLVTIAASAAHGSGLGPAAGVVHGYRTAFLITAAISLASAFIAALLPAPTKPAPGPAAPAPIPDQTTGPRRNPSLDSHPQRKATLK